MGTGFADGPHGASGKAVCHNPSRGENSQVSIKTLGTRQVYRNKWMTVREDEIERQDGRRGIYGVVDKHDCAAVLPSTGTSFFWSNSSAIPCRPVVWSCRRAAGKWRT
jgi:hypothetical protein